VRIVNIFRIILCLFSVGLLSACGGSSKTTSTAATAATTTRTQVTGIADSVNVTLSNGKVSGFSAVNVANTASFDFTETISDGLVTKFSISNASGTATFDKASGHTINQVNRNGITLIASQTTSADALLVAMPNSGFGVYMSASNASNGFGASSYAGRSGVSVVNPSGTATYRGGVIGLYGVTGSAPVYTVGDMTAAANFDSNTISFSTSGTQGLNPATGAYLGDYSALDISATNLVDSNGDNIFISNSVSDSSGLSGSAEIALFGSSGQELAGVGSLDNSASNPTKVHLISFGGDK
jgi:hypothetical protein